MELLNREWAALARGAALCANAAVGQTPSRWIRSAVMVAASPSY